MNKFIINFVIVLSFAVAGFVFMGCTQNERARHWGGSDEVKLPAGQKLVTATWKENSLWTLTRPRHAGETAEVYQFKESSQWGMMEGVVTIQEQ